MLRFIQILSFLFVNEQSSIQNFYFKVKFFPKNMEIVHIVYMKAELGHERTLC